MNFTTSPKWLVVPAALLFLAPIQAAHAQGDSFLRIVQGLSGVSKVDVTIDGQKRLNDLELGGVSDYLRLDGGPHSIVIRSNNPTQTLLSVTRRFRAGDFHSLAIYGAPARPRALVSNDSSGTPAYNRAQLTAYNLSPGTPPFDVVTYLPGGRVVTLLKNVRYGQARRASILAQPYTVRLVRNGAILKTIKGAAPRAGRKYALYAVGRPGRNFKVWLDVAASQ